MKTPASLELRRMQMLTEIAGQVQPILRAPLGGGVLESFEAKEMLAYRHSGFSVDTSVCIAAHDRAGPERLLRYCARPPFALARLRKEQEAADLENGAGRHTRFFSASSSRVAST